MPCMLPVVLFVHAPVSPPTPRMDHAESQLACPWGTRKDDWHWGGDNMGRRRWGRWGRTGKREILEKIPNGVRLRLGSLLSALLISPVLFLLVLSFVDYFILFLNSPTRTLAHSIIHAWFSWAMAWVFLMDCMGVYSGVRSFFDSFLRLGESSAKRPGG
ncbi:hypothetical protein B0J18DRAFT_163912 [Chaetomium sp. MPI-SDFR-AT-0129]|nr:hypothetical protein B0J18DRAFT_163912 [Chaetomium sp. MPI-SDFR-AT-0129]